VKTKASYGSIDVKGGICEEELDPDFGLGKAYLVACPDCGQSARLPIPKFTFDRGTLSIGPASVRFPCGWHGYLGNGIWSRSPDSSCGQPVAREEAKTMVLKENIQIGDRVDFLRSENKAVKLRGTVVKIHPDGVPCVDVALDDHDGKWIETAHIDDVTPVLPPEATEGAVSHVEPGKSFTTVNGKPV
jgi:hypothetical protein